MNKTLSTYARHCLKRDLQRCTPEQHHVFRLMYSPTDHDLAVDAVVDAMPDETLDWAMQQVERSVAANQQQSAVLDLREQEHLAQEIWQTVTGLAWSQASHADHLRVRMLAFRLLPWSGKMMPTSVPIADKDG